MAAARAAGSTARWAGTRSRPRAEPTSRPDQLSQRSGQDAVVQDRRSQPVGVSAERVDFLPCSLLRSGSIGAHRFASVRPVGSCARPPLWQAAIMHVHEPPPKQSSRDGRPMESLPHRLRNVPMTSRFSRTVLTLRFAQSGPRLVIPGEIEGDTPIAATRTVAAEGCGLSDCALVRAIPLGDGHSCVARGTQPRRDRESMCCRSTPATTVVRPGARRSTRSQLDRCPTSAADARRPRTRRGDYPAPGMCSGGRGGVWARAGEPPSAL
jgi:hypothetical protein